MFSAAAQIKQASLGRSIRFKIHRSFFILFQTWGVENLRWDVIFQNRRRRRRQRKKRKKEKMALDNQRRCLLQHRHQNARLWDKLSPVTSGGGGEEASKSSTGGKEGRKKDKNCCFSRVSSVERYLSAFENEMQEREKWQHFPESDSSWGFYPPHPPSAPHPFCSSSPGGGTSTWLQETRCRWQSTSTSFNLRCNKLNPLTGGG